MQTCKEHLSIAGITGWRLLVLCAVVACGQHVQAQQMSDEDAGLGFEMIGPENSAFSIDGGGWDLKPGFKINPIGGIDGGCALSYERTDPKAYEICASLPVAIEAGKKYKFSVWIKGESLKTSEPAMRCVAFELYKNGKFMSGGAYPLHSPEENWRCIGGELVSDVDCTARLLLYMERGVTGKLVFSNPKIERANCKPWIVHQLYPKFSSIASNDGITVFKVCRWWGGQEKDIEIQAELKNGGKAVASYTVKLGGDGLCKIDFGSGLPEGNAKIVIKVVDSKRKLVLIERTLPVEISRQQDLQRGGCNIGIDGRAFVDGAPFMPIGVYMHGISRADIRRLANSPFTCVMPYNAMSLKFDDSKKSGVAAIREVLDELDKHHIKIIFSIKDAFDGYPKPNSVWNYEGKNEEEFTKWIVGSLKDHPSILAWYIYDEPPGHEWLPRLEKRRRLVNALDKSHPTWIVYGEIGELPLFTSASDVMGLDIYPIRSPGKSDMSQVARNMNAAEKAFCAPTSAGGAIWGVPQFFNWGNYDKKAQIDHAYRQKSFVDPTEEEMRSICLLMAIKGAKGFIGYSYFDLFMRGAEPDAGKRWPEVCRVGETLKELEPFIMSGEKTIETTVLQTEGEVFTKCLSDGKGHLKVLIAAPGPGQVKAQIDIPTEMYLKSKFGRTEYLASGKYLFRGDGVCCDILE